MIKNLIFSLVITFTLVSLAGCASDERNSSTTQSSSSMAVDSKDMSHRPSQH